MAAALQILQEHKLTEYDQLAARTDAVVDRFHKLTEELQSTEAALSKTAGLMGVTGTKPRPPCVRRIQGGPVQQEIFGRA
jgi:hypothetical protein